jgi:hypothetical protein
VNDDVCGFLENWVDAKIDGVIVDVDDDMDD